MTKDQFAQIFNLIGMLITYRLAPTPSNERRYLEAYGHVERIVCEDADE
jgi:hypothetical protein